MSTASSLTVTENGGSGALNIGAVNNGSLTVGSGVT